MFNDGGTTPCHLLMPSIQIIMKTLIIPLAVLFCFACKPKSTTTADSIQGVWQNTKSYELRNNDTLYDEGRNEHKIYYKGYVMWTAEPKDSNEEHGFGTYTFKNDTLKETLSIYSIPMKIAIKEMGTNEFVLKIDLKENSFMQAYSYVSNATTHYRQEHYKRLK